MSLFKRAAKRRFSQCMGAQSDGSGPRTHNAVRKYVAATTMSIYA